MTWWDKERLQRVWEQRQPKRKTKELSQCVDTFMRRKVYPRQKKFSGLAQAWQELLPNELIDHSCLDSFQAGRLQVLVDNASYLFEMDLLIKEGLVDHLREKCPKSGLSEIKLVRGTWYRLDEEQHHIPKE
jgi:hypothetical protein